MWKRRWRWRWRWSFKGDSDNGEEYDSSTKNPDLCLTIKVMLGEADPTKIISPSFFFLITEEIYKFNNDKKKKSKIRMYYKLNFYYNHYTKFYLSKLSLLHSHTYVQRSFNNELSAMLMRN